MCVCSVASVEFMGFSRQEHSSGLPCPPPGDLLDPGIEPASPALQADSLMLGHQGSLHGNTAPDINHSGQVCWSAVMCQGESGRGNPSPSAGWDTKTGKTLPCPQVSSSLPGMHLYI